MRARRYYQLPDIPARGKLNHAVWVVVPLDRTNLWTNGSFETGTTGASAVGGSIARSASDQYHGTYSLAVTPSAGTNSDGAFFGSVSLTSGTPYVASMKFKATGAGIGRQYAISIADTSGNDLSKRTVIATGRWQWLYTPVYQETSSTNRRIYIRKVSHSAASVFYVDGVQIESCADGVLQPTTYIDGDQLGLLVGQQPAPYLWTGTPHASTSSRSALTRAGGYLMPLSAYNFLLTGLIGLGMAVPNNVSVPYTVTDGARYQRTTKPPRTFSLPGRFQASTSAELLRKQSDLRAVVDRDLVPVHQPMVLVVEPQDDCGAVIGDFAQIQCLYAGGLEGDDGNVPLEEAAPTFTMYVPFITAGDAGASLSPQTSVSNANNILQRSAAGTWSAMSTGANNQPVRAIIQGLDGQIYAGGDFTSMGTSGADFGARWNGSTWSDLSGATALNNAVYAWAVGPDGRIYAGGDFTNVDGIANADYIAVYDPSADTWAALGTGAASSGVRTLVFAPNGTLYAGGSFTGMGGVGSTADLAAWNGSAWSSIGVLNGQVLSAAVDRAGNLYIGGDFTTAGGVTVNRIAKWNGSVWSSMADGTASQVSAVAVGPDNRVYAGGSFTTIGGVSANRIAVWNGTGWAPLGSGLNGQMANNGITFSPDGVLWACGAFTTAGGITLPDKAARWNGSAWLPLDVNLPTTTIVYALRPLPDGRVIAGFDSNGTATSATVTTVTNSAPAIAWPKIVIKGPSSGTSRIYQLVNYSTGFGIWLNLTLSAGETVTINTDPQQPSAVSTFQGDISGKVLPGSQPALMYLAPGSNSISFFAASSTVTATLSWQRRFSGMADLVQ